MLAIDPQWQRRLYGNRIVQSSDRPSDAVCENLFRLVGQEGDEIHEVTNLTDGRPPRSSGSCTHMLAEIGPALIRVFNGRGLAGREERLHLLNQRKKAAVEPHGEEPAIRFLCVERLAQALFADCQRLLEKGLSRHEVRRR